MKCAILNKPLTRLQRKNSTWMHSHMSHLAEYSKCLPLALGYMLVLIPT